MVPSLRVSRQVAISAVGVWSGFRLPSVGAKRLIDGGRKATMNLPRKTDPVARTVVALFLAAIAAGYSAVDLWQVTAAVALLVVLLTRLDRS